MKTQMPSTLYHSVVLECYGSPYTLGIFTNEKSAMDRLEIARKQIVCDTPEPIWMYVETVRNGEVVARKDLNPTESRSLVAC